MTTYRNLRNAQEAYSQWRDVYEPALAAAAGIPESDVPTVKVAESKEKAQAMLDAARDTLGLSA